MKAPKVRHCPYDGTQLDKNRFCPKCNKQITTQLVNPRKPRNFYEKMPDGIEDNHVDEYFLKGLVHKSKPTHKA
jgi:hypothetical protein